MSLLGGKLRVIKGFSGVLGVWTGLFLTRQPEGYDGIVRVYAVGVTQMNSIQKLKTGSGVNRMSDFKIKAMVEHGGSIWTLNQLFQKVSGYSDHYVTDKRTNRR